MGHKSGTTEDTEQESRQLGAGRLACVRGHTAVSTGTAENLVVIQTPGTSLEVLIHGGWVGALGSAHPPRPPGAALGCEDAAAPRSAWHPAHTSTDTANACNVSPDS